MREDLGRTEIPLQVDLVDKRSAARADEGDEPRDLRLWIEDARRAFG